jgi:hypothetical protein
MTFDPAHMKHAFIRMMAMTTALLFIGVGFAIAHFMYGVGWALWAFMGFIVAGFAVQLWFIKGFARAPKGDE